MKHWVKAARLRTLPLSLSGIIVGTSLAYSKGKWDAVIFVLAILTTVLFQVISNFANDLGDAQKGTDENRVGEARMVSSGKISQKQMKTGIIICVILSLMSAIGMLYYAFLPDYLKDFWYFIGLTALSIMAALLYTLGKKPYGYYALGDLFVFLFFGLLAVLGSEFLYTKSLNAWDLLPAASIGFFGIAVLNLNNMRDFDSDIIHHKKTFAIILGKKWAKIYELVLLNLPFFLCLIYSLKNFPNQYAPLLFMLLIFPAGRIRRNIILTKFDENYDPYLKQVSILCLVFAIVFGLGISGILNF